MKFRWQAWILPKPDPERDLNALVQALRTALGSRLRSIVVFGSMVSGDFDPRRSNVNVLVLADLPLDALQAIGPALRAWGKKGQQPPVLVAPDDLDDFARDFPIEFLDMKDAHRVLYGANPLDGLSVNKLHLESEIEHDLALAQLRLRQTIALAVGDEKTIRRALIDSLPSVLTLLRSVLRLKEDAVRIAKLEAADRLAPLVGFDATVLRRLHDVRCRRASDNIKELATHYLDLIDKVLIHLRKQ